MSFESTDALLREALADSDDSAPLIVRVTGGCMAPLAVDGDRAEVVAGRAHLGDIVLACLDETYVCHRVIAEPHGPDGTFTLAGDRTWRLDRHAPDSLLGIVRAFHRTTRAGARGLRLDRGLWRHIAPWQARLHAFAYRHRRTPWGRLAEWARLAVLRVRATAWRFAQVTSSSLITDAES